MFLREAKNKLVRAGYRIIKENDGDVYSEIRELLERDYSVERAQELMDIYSGDIDDAIENGMTAYAVVEMIGDFIAQEEDDTTEELEIGDDNFEDCVDPDEYMSESKSKGKSDRFEHKAKLAGKKKSCNKKYCRNCEDEDDDDLDESYDDDMAEIEDRLVRTGAARPSRGQFDAGDMSDFRSQTMVLKKALTPMFVSNLIKDKDFEIDAQDIRDVAVKNLIAVMGTKDPAGALQRRLRRYFTGK